MFEIEGINSYAILPSSFDAVLVRLQENRFWGADILQNSGEYGWRVSAARKYSKGPLGARVIDEGSDCIIAWGITGKKSFLAYRIEQEGEGIIRVTPLAYLERTRKATLVVSLAIFFVLPVILSPLLWKVYEIQTLRASRIYLPTFCRYLDR